MMEKRIILQFENKESPESPLSYDGKTNPFEDPPEKR